MADPSSPEPRSPEPTIQSVDRAVTILETLAGRGTLGVSELARELGVHKSTASRLLAAMERRELVEESGQRGRFRLGVGVVRLAGATSARLDLVQQARPVAERLAATADATANVAVLARGSALYVDQVGSLGTLPTYTWVGQHLPLHAAANGKVLLAAQPEEEVPRIVGELTAYTDRTITDLDALQRELAAVRERGSARAVDELEVGLSTVAAPVRDVHGRVCGALSLSGPSFRMRPARLDRLEELVVEAAAAISRRMGWPA
ncbi:IclR family transcriptional regulator [Ornithinimicrobium tianjinense]|uniref:Glycerol operon regulatory protein n=1 Tax=Ornithinimicrobium tianjinense TaxID=1195761 RepID=A0A917BT80_9MICO|nr:IclR family transcriptional regulator [Ornithinimicrobium tianjinense]GGF55834.1 IclR family transcriptional regulator [Ornithinimicrobium tianjinense]